MRLASFVLVTLVVLVLFEFANARRKVNYEEDEDDASDSEVQNRKQHEFKKYNRKFADENGTGFDSRKRNKQKHMAADASTSSDEDDVLQYRRKKEERKNKKTLGDVFQEKKQKKQAKKQRFKKNVLKYFEGDESDDVESSEEFIAPLRRKLDLHMDCNSLEEQCE